MMKHTKPKVHGCLACGHGINVDAGRTITVECGQTVLSSLLADSLWTVKFDADGKVLARHETDDPADAGDSKLVRFTHQQLVKLADLDITDDTIPNHAKWPEPQSSSSSRCLLSQHHLVPSLFASRKCFTQRTRALRRRRVLMSVWTTAPLRRPPKRSWESIEPCHRQTSASPPRRNPE